MRSPAWSERINRMRSPAWSERINRALGFHEDERVRQVHGNAVRAAYIAMAIVTLRFTVQFHQGWHVFYGYGVPAALLIMSLVVLAVRRIQLNGFGAADERMIRARHSVWVWPCAVLVIGMWLLTMYQALVLGNGLALVAFPLYVLVGAAAVLLTRAWNGTLQGNVTYWLLNALFMFAVAGWNWWTTVPSTLNDVAQAALVGMVVLGIFFLLIAWRRWQEQRSADHG